MLSLALCVSYAITVILALTREEEYSKLGPHDTVSFDLTYFKSDNQLEFDFLGEHYKVQLIRSDNHLPSLIKTSGDIDPNCHYKGHVLEPYQAHGSYLSLSLCTNRGIRGTITFPHNNEQFLILPSAFVLNPEYDRNVGIYNATDPHIVYKQHSESLSSKGASRGLLKSSWRNKVELYVLVDAAWTYLFKKQYSSRWYNELVSYTTELIEAASVEYEWWDWKSLGTISLHMVELEIMGDFTGRYSSMKPRFRKPQDSGEPDCRNRDWKWNNYACLKSATDWWYDRRKPLKDFGKYHANKYGDAYLILTGFQVHVLAGLATTNSMCTSSATAMVDCSGCAEHDFYHGHKFRVKAVAHEIGHVFGGLHTSLVGIMGKGKESSSNPYYKNGWADPTISEIEDYFDDANGLSCLRNGVRSLKVTNNAGSSSGGGENNNNNDNDCIEIKSLSRSYNGEYNKGSGQIYMADPYKYLYQSNGKWTLNYRASGENSYYVCYKSNILNCDRNWFVYGERKSYGRTIKCGASFTEDDDSTQNSEYDEAICVYNYNNTDEWTFISSDEYYTNKMVYIYNDEYLLFYNEDYEYIDDEEMSGRWMISQYEIRVMDAVAICDEEDLLQCFEGKWTVSVANNDTLERMTHETMTVSNGYCATYEGARAVEEEKKGGTASYYSIALGLLLVVLLFAVGGCFIYRSKRATKVQFALDHDVVAEESDGENENEENEELETGTEIEVHTNLKQTAQ